MTKKHNNMAARADATWLRQELDKLPPVYPDRRAYDRALDGVMLRLGRHDPPPARMDASWNVAKFTWHGIASTSTSGLANAMRNWLARVDKEVGN
jgi:hypothetical protein